ncbi:hypothetical protein Ate02nite_87490 [Paractinoplanes tereljensis]|uniref:Uncharacterized protein n=1 Tax=Paractinoplanes tereljensis TaxID=571912 RepID=A0A919NVH5_9ACTN|nr:hypothetical protein Ate02nite_87490 [Actinoplanes tereljensis]
MGAAGPTGGINGSATDTGTVAAAALRPGPDNEPSARADGGRAAEADGVAAEAVRLGAVGSVAEAGVVAAAALCSGSDNEPSARAFDGRP